MNIQKLRNDFPLLHTSVDGNPLVYVDNASTSQKPQSVLDAMNLFYTTTNANVHRGVYQLAEAATTAYEQARKEVARFINAADNEIIFTRGATDGINAVAVSWGRTHIQEGDEILVTELEHHSNFVPWQQLALEKGAMLRVVPINQDGTLQMDQLERLLTKRTKLFAFSQTNHVVGTQVDVVSLVAAARAVGAKVLIDAAQSIAHKQVDVKALDADFLVFSGHKMMGPTGIGILYIKQSLHEHVPPFQFGGGMVFDVSGVSTCRFLKSPYKYEAGTPPIAQAVGLEAAIEYYRKHIDWQQLHKHETSLVASLLDRLQTIAKIQILGSIDQLYTDGHLVSFMISGMHGHDVAAYLAQYGICVRAGHHCAQPLARKLGVDASVRVSFSAYNTHEEVDLVGATLTRLAASL